MKNTMRFRSIISLVAFALSCGRPAGECVSARVTPLASCQTLPSDLSETEKQIFNRICLATTAEDRAQAIYKCAQLESPKWAEFLPLLSEIMMTEDYIAHGGRYLSTAAAAAGTMARAGTNAIPYIIKALTSDRPVEIHAGLASADNLVRYLVSRQATNELRAISAILLPYVTAQKTNAIVETRRLGWSFDSSISSSAQKAEEELRRFLPF